MDRTHELSTRGGGNRRTWLAVGGGLAAVLVLLALVIAACNAGSDRVDAEADAASGAGVAATASPEQSSQAEDPAGGGAPAGGVGSGGGDQSGGGNAGGGDQGGGGDDGGDPPADPPAPLDIEATVDTVTPGGQCFATGTIAVAGGTYPLTVHYQWRRLVLAGGFEGEPVSAVHNVNFDAPGAVSVQTDGLPEDGTNVMLIVTGPQQTGSGVVAYDGCSDGPGAIIPPGD